MKKWIEDKGGTSESPFYELPVYFTSLGNSTSGIISASGEKAIREVMEAIDKGKVVVMKEGYYTYLPSYQFSDNYVFLEMIFEAKGSYVFDLMEYQYTFRRTSTINLDDMTNNNAIEHIEGGGIATFRVGGYAVSVRQKGGRHEHQEMDARHRHLILWKSVGQVASVGVHKWLFLGRRHDSGGSRGIYSSRHLVYWRGISFPSTTKPWKLLHDIVKIPNQSLRYALNLCGELGARNINKKCLWLDKDGDEYCSLACRKEVVA